MVVVDIALRDLGRADVAAGMLVRDRARWHRYRRRHRHNNRDVVALLDQIKIIVVRFRNPTRLN